MIEAFPTLSELPPAILAQFNAPSERTKPVDREFEAQDHERNILAAQTWLEAREPAIQGDGGDLWTYKTFCGLRDMGISADVALDLVISHWNDRCVPPWEIEGTISLTAKRDTAYKSAAGDPAIFAVPENVAALDKVRAMLDAQPKPTRDRRDRVKPSEAAKWPKIEFWDTDKTMPKMAAVMIVGGVRGRHKTNVVLTKTLDAALKRGAKVLYCAGEGSHGVGVQRLPAQCVARGIELEALDDCFNIVQSVPHLPDPASVMDFIDRHKGYNPDIIVFDTLATATAGIEENGAIMGGLLTDNGPIGAIKYAFNALVIIVAHSGKGNPRTLRGHSSLEGNIDSLCFVESDGQAVLLWCEKMRDGIGQFERYYKIGPQEEVPVPLACSEAEYRALLPAKDDAKKDKTATTGESVDAIHGALLARGLTHRSATTKRHNGKLGQITDLELAYILHPRDSFSGPNDDYEVYIEQCRSRLSKRHAALKGSLGSFDAEGKGWLWHISAA